MTKRTTILGVRFVHGDPSEIVGQAISGGLVVAPSAPVLVALAENKALRDAIENSDFAITDSGLMVLLWWLLTGERISRMSGLTYLKVLLQRSAVREPGAVFWVMPNLQAMERLTRWSRASGFPIIASQLYIAPQYKGGEVVDPDLLALLNECRPKQIIIGVGGGVQERLGSFLKVSLGYAPAIHCIGAALGFVTGDQVRIPRWADHLYLGWLCRILSDPFSFVPRYWKARRLIWLLWRYRESGPPNEI